MYCMYFIIIINIINISTVLKTKKYYYLLIFTIICKTDESGKTLNFLSKAICSYRINTQFLHSSTFF